MKPEASGYKKVAIAALEPNPWNPNRMSGALFAKLVKNIEITLKQKQHKGQGLVKELPPIVVRPHPTDKDRYQIIDGFHRYKAYKQLKVLTDISIFVMDVDDEAAKLLTANLNYLRGEKDPARYTTLISEMMEGGMPLQQLGDLLPEDEADISDLITTYGDPESVKSLLSAQDDKEAKDLAENALSDDRIFVEMRFNVSVAQAKIVQKEIDRIGKVLDGNNIEGRALEFMAVQSGQTELPPELEAAKAKVPPKKDKKSDSKKSSKDRAKEKLAAMRRGES